MHVKPGAFICWKVTVPQGEGIACGAGSLSVSLGSARFLLLGCDFEQVTNDSKCNFLYLEKEVIVASAYEIVGTGD